MVIINKKYLILFLISAVLFISAIGFYYFVVFQPPESEIITVSQPPKPRAEKTATSSTYIFTKDNLVKPGSSPSLSNKDSNNDGISDGQAEKLGLDPNKLDTDGDGIFDVDEINLTKTDPLKKDTDGDGYNDLEELRNGYNPKGAGKMKSKK